MLTKNFYAVLAGLLRRRDAATYTVTVTTCKGETQTSTVFFTSTVPYSLFGMMSNGKSWVDGSMHGYWHGTYFGRGKTPATLDDYVLESPITDSLINLTSSGFHVSLNADHLLFSATHKVTNHTSEDVSIYEIGLYGGLTGSSDVPFLLDRTVLETPIIVPVGETVPIDYAIKFPYAA